MPINISIKNVPDELAERLRRRAADAHRSLQGELLAILEEAVKKPAVLTPQEALKRVRFLGLKTPPEAAEMIRQDRLGR